MRKCGFTDFQRQIWKEMKGIDSCWKCQGRTKEITCDIHSNKHWEHCLPDITDDEEVEKIYWTAGGFMTEEEYEESYSKWLANAERIKKIKENEKGLTTNFATSPTSQQNNSNQSWLILGIISSLVILAAISVIIYQQTRKSSKNK